MEMSDDSSSSSSSPLRSSSSGPSSPLSKKQRREENLNDDDDDEDDGERMETDAINSGRLSSGGLPPPAPSSETPIAMSMPRLPETEEEESARFQIELEFVQSLANPNYLNFLAQRGYFKQPSFLNYLKYLMYWKEPEYCKHLVYPQCLRLLEMLQHEKFLTELVNSQCTRFVDDQLIRVWLQYKKKHDWVRYDPTRIPDNVKHLFAKAENNSRENDTDDDDDDDRVKIIANAATAVSIDSDPFSAQTISKNEKF